MKKAQINGLLIEDNPGDAFLIQEMLTRAKATKFSIKCANTLSSGLKLMENENLDVILLDLTLPDSQKLDTFSEVHSRMPKLPIIVLSGLDDEELAVSAVQMGAQDYLVKGYVDSNLLVRSIRYAIKRKQGEEALRESEEKFRTLAEKSPNMIFINKNGKVVYANEKCEEVMGYERSELYSTGFDFLSLIAPESRNLMKKSHLNHMKGEDVKPLECTLLTKKGKGIDTLITTKLIKYEGEPSILFIITDITEHKRTQEQLIQSEKLAGIGMLATGIAHEINNPLAGIMGYAEIIQDEENHDRIREYTEKIMNNTKRASSIVKWLSRYSRDAKDHNIGLIDLNEIINESLEALKHTKKSNDIEILREYKKIPIIKGNKTELLQVFVNLLNNAAEAMPNGGKIELSTSLSGWFVEVKVSDSGIGISEDKKSRIFEPFFTTKEVGSGTGLGLYVTSVIVKKHHGIIDVHSEMGKGTTFTLKFPKTEETT